MKTGVDESTPQDESALHDEMIQALYGVGLTLEYCIALVDEAPNQAKVGLDSAITSLVQLVGQLRSHIYDAR